MSLELVITEGVESTWHYHLAKVDKFIALCGARVMDTSISLTNWDSTPENYHIPERWCSKCDQMDKVVREIL